jgi:hypothetical protein
MTLIDYFKEKTGKVTNEISIQEYHALKIAIEYFHERDMKVIKERRDELDVLKLTKVE